MHDVLTIAGHRMEPLTSGDRASVWGGFVTNMLAVIMWSLIGVPGWALAFNGLVAAYCALRLALPRKQEDMRG
jgi:hypothetical protein